MKRPRVIHLVDDMGMEGCSRHLVDLSRQLMGECAVTLVTGPRHAGEGLVRKAATAIGVPVHVLPSYKCAGERERPGNPVRELIEAFAALKPTILHTHTVDGLILARSAVKKHPVEHHVHTFHRPPEAGPGRSPETLRRALAGVTVTAAGHLLARHLEEIGLAEREKAVVITPVMAGRRFLRPRPGGALRERVGVAPREPLIGMAGGLDRDRDGLLFIKVFSTIAASIPAAKAVVAGDGPERQEMESLAARRGLTSKILFAGWNLDLPGHCGDLDLMIAAPRAEGFSIPALEALLAGVPVAGSRVHGVEELIEDGVTGLLADPGDGATLAGASILILRDEDYRSRLITAARKKGQEVLAGCDAGGAYFKLYAALTTARETAGAGARATQGG